MWGGCGKILTRIFEIPDSPNEGSLEIKKFGILLFVNPNETDGAMHWEIWNARFLKFQGWNPSNMGYYVVGYVLCASWFRCFGGLFFYALLLLFYKRHCYKSIVAYYYSFHLVDEMPSIIAQCADVKVSGGGASLSKDDATPIVVVIPGLTSDSAAVVGFIFISLCQCNCLCNIVQNHSHLHRRPPKNGMLCWCVAVCGHCGPSQRKTFHPKKL